MGAFTSTESSNNEKLTPFLESQWQTNSDLHTQRNSEQLMSFIVAWSSSQQSNSKKTGAKGDKGDKDVRGPCGSGQGNPKSSRRRRRKEEEETLCDEMLNSNSEFHCKKARNYLDRNLTVDFKLENINFYAEVVRHLDSYLKCIQRKIECNVDGKEAKSDDEKKAQQNEVNQHVVNLTHKQKICRLVLVRLSITDTYYKIMKIYQERCNGSNAKPGVEIEKIDGSETWGKILHDEGNAWKLDSGRIAKKSTENVKWRVKGIVEEFQKCKECLKQMIFLALSCKKDTVNKEDFSVLNIIDKSLVSSILDKINSYESHINNLREFIGRFKELKTISRATDNFYKEFLDCLQNIEMQKNQLKFPLFKIDLILEEENDAKFLKHNKKNKSFLITLTKRSESYFIYYLNKEMTGDENSKLTIITYFHSPNLGRWIEVPELKEGKKLIREVKNYYGPLMVLNSLRSIGLDILKPKFIKKN